MLPLTSTLFSPGVQPFLHANMLVSPCLCWMCSCNDFNKFYVQPSQHGYTWSLTKFLIPPEFYTSFFTHSLCFFRKVRREMYIFCVCIFPTFVCWQKCCVLVTIRSFYHVYNVFRFQGRGRRSWHIECKSKRERDGREMSCIKADTVA